MRKVIAAINTTMDGVLDHTAGFPDGELHQHYADLLDRADVILYGRITYQLMQYWQTLVKNPSGEETADHFARSIDRIRKIVFSHQLKTTGWESAELAAQPPEELVKALKQQREGDLLVGSRSLLIQLLKLNLIDELQLCIHPVIAGKGRLLFEQVSDRTVFKLIKTKTFGSGAVILYYEPIR
ncbi:dihydrofolate reductase [Flavobacteriaceae bacterium JJC]|nr:dihydrofolate reductase [Flavobacteriaceae bacterium JJC]